MLRLLESKNPLFRFEVRNLDGGLASLDNPSDGTKGDERI